MAAVVTTVKVVVEKIWSTKEGILVFSYYYTVKVLIFGVQEGKA